VLGAGIVTTISTAFAAAWPDLARQRTCRQVIRRIAAEKPLRPAGAAQLLRAICGGPADQQDPRRYARNLRGQPPARTRRSSRRC
jgi:hypothetical protein